MLKFMEKIRAGIASSTPTDDMVADQELQPGDKVIGVLPDELKRFYAYCFGLQKEMKAKHDELDLSYRKVVAANIVANNISVIELMAAQVRHRKEVMAGEYNTISRTFTHELYAAFPGLKDEGQPAIREGWQVVVINGIDVDDDEEDDHDADDLELSGAGANGDAKA
jgi:hypothetical protein